jgi:hypothetical protein
MEQRGLGPVDVVAAEANVLALVAEVREDIEQGRGVEVADADEERGLMRG